MKTDVKYRFSIVNFTKPDSLYTCGMKPVLYSKIEADRHFVSWTRVGDLIRYYRLFLILTDARTPGLVPSYVLLVPLANISHPNFLKRSLKPILKLLRVNFQNKKLNLFKCMKYIF